MTKRSHPELDGQNPQTLYTFHLKRPGQTLRERLTWGALGLSIGLSAAVGYLMLAGEERSWLWPPSRVTEATGADPFRQGSEQAMAAAELTQTAEFREDWADIVILWQQASDAMRLVPNSSPNAALAQEKVAEYERNRQYAQSNVDTRTSRTPADTNYWTLGSDRDLVLTVQGPPSQTTQFQSSCQQILRYDNSVVELNNGYVSQYENTDSNLKVIGETPVVVSAQAAQGTWTLGSAEADVIRIQGTPTRQGQYTATRYTTLYFGTSAVQFEEGQVIGYADVDKNLRLSLNLPPLPEGQTLPQHWSVGSSRSEVLRVEGRTPTAISRNDSNCEEVFQFDGGEVTFRQGTVTGYRNFGQTLQVN
ncbi:hypothetical protein IQ254_01700 [Nodosilinea sp. LEGE 07088]|uniref:hypothetical protein n=1 Tax=Nodosilinea sp. LEGE 07088 TaxID=2777968 RepID=UPI001881198E|nr:hypothetical protein [Nodosilinea sp. LEGE 07088]MBE9135929.1 hypothetical protein [Nodosilinea sp. LEGE 07088]